MELHPRILEINIARCHFRNGTNVLTGHLADFDALTGTPADFDALLNETNFDPTRFVSFPCFFIYTIPFRIVEPNTIRVLYGFGRAAALLGISRLSKPLRGIPRLPKPLRSIPRLPKPLRGIQRASMTQGHRAKTPLRGLKTSCVGVGTKLKTNSMGTKLSSQNFPIISPQTVWYQI